MNQEVISEQLIYMSIKKYENDEHIYSQIQTIK